MNICNIANPGYGTKYAHWNTELTYTNKNV